MINQCNVLLTLIDTSIKPCTARLQIKYLTSSFEGSVAAAF